VRLDAAAGIFDRPCGHAQSQGVIGGHPKAQSFYQNDFYREG